MIKTIIYFTREDRLTNTLGVGSIELSDYLINNEVSIEKPIINNQYKIFMIKDSLDFDEFELLWKDIMIIDEFIFYYHTAPTSHIINFLNNQPNCNCSEKGSHQSNLQGYKYFEQLKDIISDGLTEYKFNYLINICTEKNQLDEALDLLHNILDGNIINPEELSDGLKEQFEEHYNITEKYTDKYEQKLVTLRDAILKEKIK